jgi:MerR family transcriptional regulator, light-induced transcriptional regulator
MYTIKQAALRSGVNVPLLRAWERRYRIVAPARTDSGYRLYDEDAIASLRAMRTLVDGGWSARQAAEHVAAASPEERAQLANRGAASTEEPDGGSEAFVAAAARIDAPAIERVLDEMFASGSFERVVEDRLYPALTALGEGWASGAVDVAGEHAASSAAVRRLSMAFEAAGNAGSGERPVLVGLPPGMRHEIGALGFAVAARRSGFNVVYLGPDVPVASWAAAVDRTRARAAVLGAVMDGDISAADEAVATLREAAPEIVIAMGGRRSREVGNGGVLRLPDGLREAVQVLRAALS